MKKYYFVYLLDWMRHFESTIKATKNRGYNIKVITDAIISETDSLKNRTLADYTEMSVELQTTKEFLQIINE